MSHHHYSSLLIEFTLLQSLPYYQTIGVIMYTIQSSILCYFHRLLRRFHCSSAIYVTYSLGSLYYLIFIALHRISSFRDLLTIWTPVSETTLTQVDCSSTGPCLYNNSQMQALLWRQPLYAVTTPVTTLDGCQRKVWITIVHQAMRLMRLSH